jgi:septum formation protein
MARVILASASPRRKQLLEEMGFEVHVLSVSIDETQYALESPREYLYRVVRLKISAALGVTALEGEAEAEWTHQIAAETPVLAADTIVCFDENVLQKPSDDADARRMLQMLSGRSHEVVTRFAIARQGFWHEQSVATLVTFRCISDVEIDEYVRTAEGRDKAGSYAIQGRAAKFVRKINGSYGAVVGLPSCEVSEALAHALARP